MQIKLSARFVAIGIAAGFILTGIQPSYGAAAHHHRHKHDRTHAKNIVATLAAAGNFKTLTKALAAAGLAKTLESDGPYTVFAPDDAAFHKVPQKELDDWMKNPKTLKHILLYHVVRGTHSAESLQKSQTLKTLSGDTLAVNYKEQVEVGGSLVKKADIKASNGLIQQIDEVLVPVSIR